MNSTHDDSQRDGENKDSSGRAFGLVFSAVFLAIGLMPLFYSGPPRAWALAVAAVFGLAALTAPRLLAWPSRVWLRFGALLHNVASPLGLTMVFYAAIVPTGLLMRLFGKDLLGLRRMPQVTSYWIARKPPGPAPDSLKNQF